MLKKIGEWCIKIEDILGGLFHLTIFVLVFLGTVVRYTGWYNMFWSDEASRYCMIWSVLLLAGLSAQRGQMFSIDLLSAKLPIKGQKVFAIVRFVLVVAFCWFCCVYGGRLVQKQMVIHQVSPSMKIPMWFMYSSIPFSMFLLIIHYFALTYTVIKKLSAEEKEGK